MIEAVIQVVPSYGKVMELSVKEILPDPWETIYSKYQPGTLIHCAVKLLYPGGVVVSILPEVDGYISRYELTTLQVEKPADFLWVGDRLEAVITQVDKINRRIRLSVKKREERTNLVQSFMENLEKSGIVSEADSKGIGNITAMKEIDSPIQLPGPVLLINGNPAVRGLLITWLINNNCEVCSFESLEEAKAIPGDPHYSVAIIDLA